jgi:hypothetical protein
VGEFLEYEVVSCGAFELDPSQTLVAVVVVDMNFVQARVEQRLEVAHQWSESPCPLSYSTSSTFAAERANKGFTRRALARIAHPTAAAVAAATYAPALTATPRGQWSTTRLP